MRAGGLEARHAGGVDQRPSTYIARSTWRVLGLALSLVVASAAAAAGEPGKRGNPGQKMAVTTASPEARALYLQGFDLLERRRHADAYARCREAVAVDPELAVAHLCLYITTGSKTEALDEMRRAVSLADKATEPERLWILSDDAIVRGDAAAEKRHIDRIVELLPDDEHAYNLLAAYHYRRAEWAEAIKAYAAATRIAPSYTLAYNQLGYCYEFLGRYAEAEAAFQKYIELLPGDPNPYDSYAELLMKMGNYRGSIEQYDKALAIDPKFATAYIGAGNDEILLGRFAEARRAFARLVAAARTAEDRRQGWLWTALSHVHEGHTAEAIAAIGKATAIAQTAGDQRGIAADLHLTGDILLDAARPAEAAAAFSHQAATVARAPAPTEVRAADQRDARFDRARVALATHDLAAARAERDALLRESTDPRSQFRAHELAGRVALADHDATTAVAELDRSDPRNPRARYLLAVALEAKGDLARARTIFAEVAAWNAVHPDLAFVRGQAAVAANRLRAR
jgi:tetratricopeptide (TPR) repeat protein